MPIDEPRALARAATRTRKTTRSVIAQSAQLTWTWYYFHRTTLPTPRLRRVPCSSRRVSMRKPPPKSQDYPGLLEAWIIRERLRLNRRRPVAGAKVLRGTRPRPIISRQAESAANRVLTSIVGQQACSPFGMSMAPGDLRLTGVGLLILIGNSIPRGAAAQARGVYTFFNSGPVRSGMPRTSCPRPRCVTATMTWRTRRGRRKDASSSRQNSS